MSDRRLLWPRRVGLLVVTAAVLLATSGCGILWPGGDGWEGDPPFPGTWERQRSGREVVQVRLSPDGTAWVLDFPVAASSSDCGDTASETFSGAATWRNERSDLYVITVAGQDYDFTYGRQYGYADWESLYFGPCSAFDDDARWDWFLGTPSGAYYQNQ